MGKVKSAASVAKAGTRSGGKKFVEGLGAGGAKRWANSSNKAAGRASKKASKALTKGKKSANKKVKKATRKIQIAGFDTARAGRSASKVSAPNSKATKAGKFAGRYPTVTAVGAVEGVGGAADMISYKKRTKGGKQITVKRRKGSKRKK